jgi:ankyrin repeat protein
MTRWLVLGGLAGTLGLAAALVLFALRPQPVPTPLGAAAAHGDVERLHQLAAPGTLDQPGAGGFTPLDWAAREGQTAAIEALLAAGANPDAYDRGINGWTALHHAIHRRQPAAVAVLLAHGADPNRPSLCGETPLMLAAGEGWSEMVETLLAGGADPRRTVHTPPDQHLKSWLAGALFVHEGRSALSFAALGGDLKTVKVLRDAAPDLRLSSDSWWDRLTLAILRVSGRRDVMQALRVRPATAVAGMVR